MNSKQKGGSWERKVCVSLSKWISDGKRSDLLWRSAMSGGRATVNRKRGIANKSQLGDISSVAPEGHALTDRFVIECKAYRDLAITRGLLLGAGHLATFWAQVCGEAVVGRKLPMLIAKQNNFLPLLILSPKGAVQLGLMDFVWAKSYRLGVEPACICAFTAIEEVEFNL